MNQGLTLETVLNDFTHWRKARKKRCAVPDELWRKTFSILNKYPVSKVCSTLGLNASQIKAKMAMLADNRPELSKKFAEVLIPTGNCDLGDSLSAKIVRQDGAILFINALSYPTIKMLIDDFLVAK